MQTNHPTPSAAAHIMGWYFDGIYRCSKHEPFLQRDLGAPVEELTWTDRDFYDNSCELCGCKLNDLDAEADGARGYKMEA